MRMIMKKNFAISFQRINNKYKNLKIITRKKENFRLFEMEKIKLQLKINELKYH